MSMIAHSRPTGLLMTYMPLTRLYINDLGNN